CSNRISVVGVEGENIVLAPPVAGNGSPISWKKGENIVATSRFSFSPGNEKQRLSFDSFSGNLSLKNLSKEDTGNYTAEIFINEKIKKTCFDLKILVQPDINCTVYSETIQLSCTSASQDLLLEYSWDVSRNEEIIYQNDSVIRLQRNSNHSSLASAASGSLLVLLFGYKVSGNTERKKSLMNETLQQRMQEEIVRKKLLGLNLERSQIRNTVDFAKNIALHYIISFLQRSILLLPEPLPVAFLIRRNTVDFAKNIALHYIISFLQRSILLLPEPLPVAFLIRQYESGFPHREESHQVSGKGNEEEPKRQLMLAENYNDST
ncbi:hypothetical protein E2320_022921, partial [Naja naja]